MLFPDQWRGDWTSFHGLPLNMPTFDGLAKSGVRFTQAYVPSPLCAPSRACLASGKQYDEAGVPDNFSNDYPLNQTTIYQLLQAAGYHTMTAGKDDLTKATGMGLNGTYHAAALGFSDYARSDGKEDAVSEAVPSDPYGLWCSQHNATVNGSDVTWWDILKDHDPQCCEKKWPSADGYVCDQPSYMPQTGYEDDYITTGAVALLQRKPQGQPWFLQVNFAGPHPPFVVTGSMMNDTKNRTFPKPYHNTELPESALQTTRRDYAAELEHLDSMFGRILAAVQQLGELANTLVIVASDHGEMLGDWNDWGKTQPWQGSVSVPLVISAPSLGVPSGLVVNRPVATLDIAGTVLEYAGVQPDPNLNMTTRSLRPLFTNASVPEAYRTVISSGLSKWRMVVQLRNATDKAPVLKFICCDGKCPGQPPNATTVLHTAALDELNRTGPHAWVKLMYEPVTDPFDSENVIAQHPNAVPEMEQLLPPGWCH
jgi:arylsulfatase A-like enzyme